MAEILSDFSDEALIHAVRQNFYDLLDYLAGYGQTDFFQVGDFKRWWMPIPYPWYNAAMSLRAPSEDASPLIQDTIAYFQSKERGLFTWWLGHDVAPSAWEPYLFANGLKPDTHTPGMAVSLDDLNLSIHAPDGLKIVQVQDSETMKAWVRVFIQGYDLPLDWEAPALALMLDTGLKLPWWSYLAYLHDEPVATGAVFFGAGVAGIQMVATLPAWRGKGIGAAVTLQPLLDARAMGYRIGILQASDMGFSVYKRLGFKEVCRMNHYYWREE